MLNVCYNELMSMSVSIGVCEDGMCVRVSAKKVVNNFPILSTFAPDMFKQMLDKSHWWGLKNNTECWGEETEWHRAP